MGHVSQRQLARQCEFIRRLEQTGSEFAMYFYRGRDDDFGNAVVLVVEIQNHLRGPPCPPRLRGELCRASTATCLKNHGVDMEVCPSIHSPRISFSGASISSLMRTRNPT